MGNSNTKRILMHTAARQGNLKLMKTYVEQGAELETKDDNGQTPFHVAASHGHCNIVEYIVQLGADVTIKDNNGMTPLHVVTEKLRARFSIVKYLVDKGAGINIKDNRGQTPLHTAAAKGHDYTVMCLIKNGADISIKDKNGRTPLDVALNKGHGKVAEILQEGIDEVDYIPDLGKEEKTGHNWKQLGAVLFILLVLLLVIGIGLWWMLDSESIHTLWSTSEHDGNINRVPSEEL